MTKQAARMGSRLAIVFYRHLTVNHYRTEPLGLAHTSPFSTRQIMHDLHRSYVKLLVVVDYDVGGRDLAWSRPITQAVSYTHLTLPTTERV